MGGLKVVVTELGEGKTLWDKEGSGQGAEKGPSEKRRDQKQEHRTQRAIPNITERSSSDEPGNWSLRPWLGRTVKLS